MKKIIVAALVLFVINTQAQDEKCFNKGTSAINLGVGIGNNVNYGSYTNSGITPIYAFNYEYGVAKAGAGVVGIGVSASYMSFNVYNPSAFIEPNAASSITQSIKVVGLRGTYHPDFCNGKKYDVYAAVQLNIYSNTPNDLIYLNNHVYINPCLLIGFRYFFIPNIGVFAELGNDFAVLKGGLSIKFGGK